MKARYDKLAGAVAKILPVQVGSCTIQAIRSLFDLSPDMRNNMACLVISKFGGNPSARLDTLLVDTFDLPKKSKLFSNLTPRHEFHVPGHRWTEEEPWFEVGRTQQNIPRNSSGSNNNDSSLTKPASSVSVPTNNAAPVPPAAMFDLGHGHHVDQTRAEDLLRHLLHTLPEKSVDDALDNHWEYHD